MWLGWCASLETIININIIIWTAMKSNLKYEQK